MIFATTLLACAALLCGATAHAQTIDCSSGVEFVPHPTDCTLFYACLEGEPILEYCPTGLWWNPTTNQCDWPDEAFCSPGSSTSTSATSSGTSTTDATTGTGTATTPQNPCVGNEPEFFPHPTDCTLFYKCYQGEAILETCPPGLWWHQELGECDWPDVSFCTPGSSTSSGSSTGTTETPIGPDMPCPTTGSETVRYPHLTDCKLYHLCLNGATQLYSCSEGQEFDPLERHCKDTDAAGCSQCPTVAVSGVVVRLPHESECHLYYRCAGTNQELFQCQLDHYFSRFDRNCHPQAASFCSL